MTPPKLFLWLISPLWFCLVTIFVPSLLEAAEAEAEAPGGPYSITLGVAYPQLTQIKHYADLYGRSSYLPEFGFAFDLLRLPGATFFTGFGIAYYTDVGNEVKYPKTADAPLEKIDNRLQLVLIPYHFTAGMQFFPLQQSFFALKGWLGYEELYYRETRTSNNDANPPPVAGGVSARKKANADDAGNYANTGWNAAISYGVALQFNVSSIEERHVRSLAAVTDFSQIYVAPFFEATYNLSLAKTLITQREISSVNLQRQSYGIAFTYASAR